MKLTTIIAFLLMSLDCAEKAMGISTQTIFSAGYQWLWWIGAVGWFIDAICICFMTVDFKP